jgi:hypothetical protein
MHRKLSLLVSLCVVVLVLGGCEHLSKTTEKVKGYYKQTFPDETISVDGEEYRTGFYSYLFPRFGPDDPHTKLKTEAVYNDGLTDYHRVVSAEKSWIHAFVGGLGGGTVYCLDSQWDTEKAIYSNPDNFNYFYTFDKFEPKSDTALLDIDPKKVDALIDFVENTSYDPFDTPSNNAILENVVRFPEESDYQEVVLYKESKDGFFTAGRANSLFLLNGTLFVLFYHDGGSKNNGIAEIVGTKVPIELGSYLIDIVDWGKDSSVS